MTTDEDEVSFWRDENVLELDNGGGCTTFSSPIVHFKRVNFVVYELYFN